MGSSIIQRLGGIALRARGKGDEETALEVEQIVDELKRVGKKSAAREARVSYLEGALWRIAKAKPLDCDVCEQLIDEARAALSNTKEGGGE